MKVITYTKYSSPYGPAIIENLDAFFFDNADSAWKDAKARILAYIRSKAALYGKKALSSAEALLKGKAFNTQLNEVISPEVAGHRRIIEKTENFTIEIHNDALNHEIYATTNGYEYLHLVVKE